MELSQITIACVGAVVALYSVYRHLHPVGFDINVAEPLIKRTDLLYGYYGAMNNQASEVKDHTNLWWESQFQGEEKAIANILETKQFTILDITNQCMKRDASTKKFLFNTDCELNLRFLFTKMQKAGALEYVKVLYPMDEPNINSFISDVRQAIDTIKKVIKDYPEIADVKIGTVYASKPETYECIEYFDWVGIDDYDQKSSIFVNGMYTNLKSRLRADQRTVIMPGGAFGQDPTPFINFAHSNPEVVAVVPFTWLGPMVPADKWVGLGDDKNPLKQSYIMNGKLLTGK